MRSTLRGLGACTVAVVSVLAATAIPSPALAEVTTGSIAGTVTDTGAPVSGVSISVYDTTFTFITSSGTDSEGRYAVADLPAGQYKVQFWPSGGISGLSQFAHQKPGFDFEAADTFTVTAGETTVVDEELLPTGSITGVLTDGGRPAAAVDVMASPVGSQFTFGHATTDDQGRFAMTYLLPGQYRVEFQLPGFVTQYHPGQLDPSQATPVTVAVGQVTDIAETLLPTGSVSGRVMEDGAPVEGVHLQWWHENDITTASATTDADGRYALPAVFAGSYRVSFQFPGERFQWAHGKLDRDTADVFTVTAGAQTVVDETALPTGRVVVRAVDALTGAPVSGFCAEIRAIFACTDGDVAEAERVPVGRHPVTIFPFGDEHLSGATGEVEVVAGATAETTVRLTPAAIITTVVRDRATGAPVENVCVDAIRPILASFPDGSGSCTDGEGRVRVGRLAAGTYTLFARPQDGVHGAQWVGESGGTGNQLKSWRVTVSAGQAVTAPPVLLDAAGSVSGQVTDKTTGQPLADATVSLLTSHPGLGPTGPNAATGADGRYTLDGLGPYAWPLRFDRFQYAPQWSGGVQSRLLATPVRVTAGQAATADSRMTMGTEVRGTITVGGELLTEGAWVVGYDAVLGDIAGVSFSFDGTYSLRVLGPTAIRIRVDSGRGPSRWHRDAADFQHATVVLVPSSGTKTVDVAFS